LLFVPCVGYGPGGYRLGYGGGYYDRTLAAMEPRPMAIGVGYELGRLSTIHPQPHDMPLDAIVTEAGVERFERDPGRASQSIASPEEDPNVETIACSSPPCFMHEFEDR
jgi:hypothetical protein